MSSESVGTVKAANITSTNPASLSNGAIPVWNSATLIWEPGTAGSGPSSVGTGGSYSTVKAAVLAGKTDILLISNTTDAASITLTANTRVDLAGYTWTISADAVNIPDGYSLFVTGPGIVYKNGALDMAGPFYGSSVGADLEAKTFCAEKVRFTSNSNSSTWFYNLTAVCRDCTFMLHNANGNDFGNTLSKRSLFDRCLIVGAGSSSKLVFAATCELGCKFINCTLEGEFDGMSTITFNDVEIINLVTSFSVWPATIVARFINGLKCAAGSVFPGSISMFGTNSTARNIDMYSPDVGSSGKVVCNNQNNVTISDCRIRGLANLGTGCNITNCIIYQHSGSGAYDIKGVNAKYTNCTFLTIEALSIISAGASFENCEWPDAYVLHLTAASIRLSNCKLAGGLALDGSGGLGNYVITGCKVAGALTSANCTDNILSNCVFATVTVGANTLRTTFTGCTTTGGDMNISSGTCSDIAFIGCNTQPFGGTDTISNTGGGTRCKLVGCQASVSGAAGFAVTAGNNTY